MTSRTMFRVLPWIVLVALLALPAQAQAVRVSGKVVDESGEALTGVDVVMTPAESVGAKVEASTSGKKGRFTFPRLRHGAWTPNVRSDAYVLKAVKAELRNSDQSITRFNEDNAEVNGPPKMSLPLAGRVSLTLVVGERKVVENNAGAGIAGIESAVQDVEVMNALMQVSKWDELIEKSSTFLQGSEYRDSDLGAVHYLRAVAMWKTGAYDEAHGHFEQARQLIPEHPGMDGVIGAAYLEQADGMSKAGQDDAAQAVFAKAAEALQRQIEATPDARAHRINLVIAQERGGDLDAAIGTLQQLAAEEPSDTRVRTRLAELLVDRGRGDEAMEILAALEPTPATAELIYGVAQNLWNLGKGDEALQAVEKAIAIQPEARYFGLKGTALVSAGDNAGALESLKKALELDPDDPQAPVYQQLIQALGG